MYTQGSLQICEIQAILGVTFEKAFQNHNNEILDQKREQNKGR